MERKPLINNSCLNEVQNSPNSHKRIVYRPVRRMWNPITGLKESRATLVKKDCGGEKAIEWKIRSDNKSNLQYYYRNTVLQNPLVFILFKPLGISDFSFRCPICKAAATILSQLACSLKNPAINRRHSRGRSYRFLIGRKLIGNLSTVTKIDQKRKLALLPSFYSNH